MKNPSSGTDKPILVWIGDLVNQAVPVKARIIVISDKIFTQLASEDLLGDDHWQDASEELHHDVMRHFVFAVAVALDDVMDSHASLSEVLTVYGTTYANWKARRNLLEP
jgi:hypothetical protein